jgi:hypothetical protein
VAIRICFSREERGSLPPVPVLSIASTGILPSP